MKIRLLLALAFDPTENLVEAFDILRHHKMPEDAQGAINYFDDYWIGCLQRRKEH